MKINKQQVRDDFSNAACTYDKAAIVQHEICDRTLEKLDMLKLQPTSILDIGTGTGRSLQGLQSRFPDCRPIACDIALSMLTRCRQKMDEQQSSYMVCNDAEQLPFADAAFDLIFSSSTFQWCENLYQLFSECKRVLRVNGVLIFSTFGPDTLVQLRKSWAQIDDDDHVHEFIDMHHIGDILLEIKFQDPVVDMEIIDMQYQSLQQLLQDLKDTGSRSKFRRATEHSSIGLTSKEKYQRLQQAYEIYRQKNGLLPASYEVIYGYARKASQEQTNVIQEEITVPFSDIKRKI